MGAEIPGSVLDRPDAPFPWVVLNDLRRGRPVPMPDARAALRRAVSRALWMDGPRVERELVYEQLREMAHAGRLPAEPWLLERLFADVAGRKPREHGAAVWLLLAIPGLGEDALRRAVAAPLAGTAVWTSAVRHPGAGPATARTAIRRWATTCPGDAAFPDALLNHLRHLELVRADGSRAALREAAPRLRARLFLAAARARAGTPVAERLYRRRVAALPVRRPAAPAEARAVARAWRVLARHQPALALRLLARSRPRVRQAIGTTAARLLRAPEPALRRAAAQRLPRLLAHPARRRRSPSADPPVS